MVLDVSVTETLRLLPVLIIRVTDENGLSAGPGLRAINLLGHGSQTGVALRFGGETGVSVTVDATTMTPGTWMRHVGFSYTSRENELYNFDERATTADVRLARNWNHGLRTGVAGDVLAIDTGSSGASLSDDGTDVVPTLGGFVTLDTLDSSTNPRSGTWAEAEVDRLFGNASSWTFIVDGRRFQRLSDRHGLGLFSLATFQTGEVGVGLPAYLQFDLGGANSVRGWTLGSRRGRNQFIGTAEYTYVVQPVRPFTVKGLNLYAGLQVVGFADLGRAWDGGERSGDRVGHRRLRRRASAPRPICGRHPARPRVGRAGPGRDRLLRRVAQGRPTAPAGSMNLGADGKAGPQVTHQPRDAADDML